MSAFKVGDRVRVVLSGDERGGSCHEAAIGTITTITSVDQWGNDVEYTTETGWFFHESEIELVPVAEATGTLRIEAGKFYRTRDGRKVGPMALGAWGGFYDTNRRYTGYNWNKDGSYIEGDVCQLDLIAEWVDEPAVAPATAKFKVGDRVKFRDDYGYGVGGKEATVVELNVWGGGKGVKVIKGGEFGSISTEREEDLVPAATPPTNAIVALIEDGQPKPSVRPYVHASREAAETEATRLAGKHPSKEFGVYELVATKREAKVYDFEWQRLAAEGRKIEAIKDIRSRVGLTLKGAKDAVEHWLELEAA